MLRKYIEKIAKEVAEKITENKAKEFKHLLQAYSCDNELKISRLREESFVSRKNKDSEPNQLIELFPKSPTHFIS